MKQSNGCGCSSAVVGKILQKTLWMKEKILKTSIYFSLSCNVPEVFYPMVINTWHSLVTEKN